MVHTLSRRTSTKELESFGEFNEGIEHLWSKAAQQPTWNLAMKQINQSAIPMPVYNEWEPISP